MGLEVSFSGDFASCIDPVTNSYGESWDSSCEKSWVPVKKKESEIENAWAFM